MKLPISVVIAIAFGLVVLLGFFIPLPLLVSLRLIFLRWAVILSAVALLVGVGNLALVHWRKVAGGRSEALYSTILLLSMAATLVIAGWQGPTGFGSLWIFNYIQVPVETSLMALLAVLLAYACARLFYRRPTLFSLIFALTALIVLLGTAPLLGFNIPGLQGPDGLRALIVQIPAAAGARGILLGVALGIIATGLRVLMGAERPYGG
jgi:hypothetical protein